MIWPEVVETLGRIPMKVLKPGRPRYLPRSPVDALGTPGAQMWLADALGQGCPAMMH